MEDLVVVGLTEAKWKFPEVLSSNPKVPDVLNLFNAASVMLR
jgi:hypothetical protein